MMANAFFMASIFAARLGGVFLLFVLLARYFGVEEFGIFSISYSLAAIFVISIDYGYSQSILYEIGKGGESIEKIVASGLKAKLFLVLLITLLFLIFLVTDSLFVKNKSVLVILYVAAIFFSFAEFFGVTLRAEGVYKTESFIQTGVMILMIGSVVFAGYWSLPLVWFAVIICFCRMLHLILVVLFLTYDLRKVLRSFSCVKIRHELKKSFPFATDQALTNLMSNIDVIMVSYVLGVSQVGIYQAGQKLVQGYSALALVVSNLFLPKLSRYYQVDSFKYRKIIKLCALVLLALGFSGGLLFWQGEEILVAFIYGDEFKHLVDMMPAFGLLVFVRFVSGVFGLTLVSKGKQSVRVICNSFGLIMTLTVSLWLISKHGAVGMVYSQIASVSFVMTLYILLLIFYRNNNA